jgi:hypothetical protein
LVWIRIGFGFSNSLEPSPDSAKYLDPNTDSVNSDPKHKKYELVGIVPFNLMSTYKNDKFATPIFIFQPGNVCIVLHEAGLLAATLGKLLRYPFLLPNSEFYVFNLAYCGSDSFSLLVKFSNSKNNWDLVHWTAKPKP